MRAEPLGKRTDFVQGVHEATEHALLRIKSPRVLGGCFSPGSCHVEHHTTRVQICATTTRKQMCVVWCRRRRGTIGVGARQARRTRVGARDKTSCHKIQLGVAEWQDVQRMPTISWTAKCKLVRGTREFSKECNCFARGGERAPNSLNKRACKAWTSFCKQGQLPSQEECKLR